MFREDLTNDSDAGDQDSQRRLRAYDDVAKG